MTTTFTPDALLGLEIDEHLDEHAFVACESPGRCPNEAVILSICPLCGHGYAWCQDHYDRWQAKVHWWETTFPSWVENRIVCPPEHGGCGGDFLAADMIFRPLR